MQLFNDTRLENWHHQLFESMPPNPNIYIAEADGNAHSFAFSFADFLESWLKFFCVLFLLSLTEFVTELTHQALWFMNSWEVVCGFTHPLLNVFLSGVTQISRRSYPEVSCLIFNLLCVGHLQCQTLPFLNVVVLKQEMVCCTCTPYPSLWHQM